MRLPMLINKTLLLVQVVVVKHANLGYPKQPCNFNQFLLLLRMKTYNYWSPKLLPGLQVAKRLMRNWPKSWLNWDWLELFCFNSPFPTTRNPSMLLFWHETRLLCVLYCTLNRAGTIQDSWIWIQVQNHTFWRILNHFVNLHFHNSRFILKIQKMNLYSKLNLDL